MQETSRGLRLHIGIFGRRNAGKSSVLNALTGQRIAIVSEVAGTTADPVQKAMELQPLGPVVFVDTAGLDDAGVLGRLRVEKTLAVLDRIDVAILVADGWSVFEDRMVDFLRERKVPFVVVANKCDLGNTETVLEGCRQRGIQTVVHASATTGEGIHLLRGALVDLAPEELLSSPAILPESVRKGDLVLLVVPIDSEAPKGRIILPQVQTLRAVLDRDACAVVVKDHQLSQALASLRRPPSLVITDSQQFARVAGEVAENIPLTSFSILFSRFKGDLESAVEGLAAMDRLQPGDRVLIAEGCTHHPTGEDIGRVKLPRWLRECAGGELRIDIFSGPDFPADLEAYRLVIHCGACVLTRRHMLSRIQRCRDAGVPITNYGLAIAHTLGISERALRPFVWEHTRFLEMTAGR